MRTVAQIKGEMTTAFMANGAIRNLYDPNNTWTNSTTFDSVFASTSLESVIFYIVAVCAYGLEVLLAKHQDEVDAFETRMRVGQKEWWRQLVLNFQYDYDLIFDSTSNTFKYDTNDDLAKVIKYCDVRTTNSGLSILLNEADDYGEPMIIDSEHDVAFRDYFDKMKLDGIHVDINSLNPDQLKIYLEAVINPLVMDSQGALYSTGEKTVETAIKNYLKTIPFGSGVLNKNALIDAVQRAEGIEDGYPNIIDWLVISSDLTPAYTPVTTQNKRAYGGSFKVAQFFISYVSNV